MADYLRCSVGLHAECMSTESYLNTSI